MSARCSPAVAEFSATACAPPKYSAHTCSKRWTFGPVVIQPERSESTTSAISSSSIVGCEKGRNEARRGRSASERDMKPSRREQQQVLALRHHNARPARKLCAQPGPLRALDEIKGV